MEQKYAVSYEIENIVNRWLDQEPDLQQQTGRISLLPAQTGSGKSYVVSKIMGERTASDFPHTMIYMVHTKENLKNEYLDLLEMTPAANEKTIMLKEDAEMLIDFFEHSSIEEFEAYKEYQELRQIVNVAIEYKKRENKTSISYMHLYRVSINKEKKTLQERLIKEHKKLKPHQKKAFKLLTSRIFPTANLQAYRAIFLTTRKFMYPIWTLSGSTFLYEMEDFKDSKLFIDEFDAQKNQVLDLLTKEAAESIIEKISFFLNSRHILKESVFLQKYAIDKKHISSIQNQFEKVYKTYIQGFSFVYRSEDEAIRYILRSQSISSFESTKKPLTINKDKEQAINWVESGDDYQFSNMLKDIDSAIKRLAGLGKRVVKIRKEETYKIKETTGSKEWIDWIHIRDSIMRQFIGEFNLSPSDESYKYFKRLILHRLEEDQYTLLPSEREEFYDNGLSLVQMEDTGEDVKRSSFHFYNLSRTPENFLVKVASYMHIIAISATVGIETVIRNFDLAYLKTKVHVETLNKEHIDKLNRLYIEGKDQTNRKFHVDFIDTESLNIDKITGIWFNGDRKAARLLQSLFPPLQDFQKERYIRLIYLYWEFITNREIKSFLVLLNAYPDDTKSITRTSLTTLFSMMLIANKNTGKLKPEVNSFILRNEKEQKPFIESDLFFVAKSDEYSKQKFTDEIQNTRLRCGGSAFVISVYQAMGAGRNIHYSAGEGKNKQEKDYDAIYCEKPTHLLVRGWEDGTAMSSLLKLLYQLHALHASYSIDKNTFILSLRKAMAVNAESWNTIGYSSGEDYNNAVMITIIQAIGRLHRANNPRDPIHIFLDNGLHEVIEKFDPTGHTLLPSVIKVLEEAGNQQDIMDSQAFEFNKVVARKSSHMLGRIKRLLKSLTDEKTVDTYESYKKHLLSHPTMENLDHRYSGLYTPKTPKGLLKYWYKEEEDYKNVEISPVKRGGDFIEVSSTSARLHILIKVPELTECFKEEGIATDFIHPHLMTPVVFNNFYKGSLGEAVGKWIFEKHCGIKLNVLPIEDGYYEFFDFVSDNNIIVDFKYYSRYRIENTSEDKLRLGKTGAIAKREKMGAKLAVIINIFYMGGHNQVSREISIVDGIAIVPFIIDASKPDSPKLDSTMIMKIKDLFL